MDRTIDFIKIQNQKFESFSKTLIIAEISSNHNNNINIAFKLIDAAKKAGCDAVKFQLFSADKIIQKKLPGWKILKKFELPFEWLFKLKKYSKRRKLLFSVSPFDLDSARKLSKLGIDFFKIASPEIEDLPLVDKIASFKKPTIISTGGAKMSEISLAVEKFREKKHNNFSLLHCVSIYPASVNKLNLRMINSLRKSFNVPIGFSDHSKSMVIPSVAVALGACIIEKHITLNKKSIGPDHNFALEPHELEKMVKYIRETTLAFGNPYKQPIIKNEKKIGRRLVAQKNIKKGKKIKIEDIIVKRAKLNAIKPKDLYKVLSLKLTKNILKDQEITWKHFK